MFFIKRADINKYKSIKSPRFKIGFIELAKVSTIFLNLSHYYINLNILSRRKAFIIPKFEPLPYKAISK
jgi:hypothetical protein